MTYSLLAKYPNGLIFNFEFAFFRIEEADQIILERGTCLVVAES